ncbi:hypothetical protein FORC065_1291 [Yersinia enterocolitica]|nr:hypothetical protein FORC065_1291 [Yersinia enterocolitica]
METEQNFTALVETLPLIRPLNRIKKKKNTHSVILLQQS